MLSPRNGQDWMKSAIGKMSEESRYELARKKTSEITAAQLKYMKDHPGETIKDFAKSATLINTPETFKAIGKDLAEVANGDANTWARWAAGTGAGAKISGWLLALASIVYVASWFTGIGELATIATAAGYLLGATLTLSAVESELRIKAASQAKTPEEFKRQVESGQAARANVFVGASLIVVAFVLHFTAKTLFPKTMENIRTTLKNLRERIRLKGSVYDLKVEIVNDMSVQKIELIKNSELAKQKALDAATELEGLSINEFVEKLEKGDNGGILDQSKVSSEQEVNYRELLNTKEGRGAIEVYKQNLSRALKTEVVAEIDKLGQEYISRIDEFLKEVDKVKNHDELAAATDKLEGILGEKYAKEFMQKEQEAITKRKLEEAAKDLEKELATVSSSQRARDLAKKIAEQGHDVIANLGGAGAKHEPAHAININNMTVGRKDIPNLVVADGSDIGTLFDSESLDGIVGYGMAPGVIDWSKAAPGAYRYTQTRRKIGIQLSVAESRCRIREGATAQSRICRCQSRTRCFGQSD